MDFPRIRIVHPVRAAGAALVVLALALGAFGDLWAAHGATQQVTTAYACIMPSGGPARVWAFAPTCTGGQVIAWSVHGTASTTTTTKPPTTLPPTVTTTTVGPPAGGNSPPPPGGYFALSAPGTPFPSDAVCAAQVHHSSWEPRPDNTTANHTVPPAGYLTATNPDWDATWNANYRTRITGNFTGTTDEIIQWAACKWRWPDELVRGEAVDETNWHQNGTGDTSSTAANCFPGYSAPCPTSFGLLQIKWYFNPSHTIAGNAMPWARDSTAFAIDYTLAELRGCYDGLSTYLGNTTGNVAGCVGAWWSGSWDPTGGAYWSRVNAFTQAKDWLKPAF